jgi:hypothetical protein
VPDVSKRLGIAEGVLYTWVSKFKKADEPEAKSLRLQALAVQNDCAVFNLSNLQSSRLLIPRIELQTLERMTNRPATNIFNNLAVHTALRAESELGYQVESGRYWEEYEQFDCDKLNAIDALWLRIASPSQHSPLSAS